MKTIAQILAENITLAALEKIADSADEVMKMIRDGAKLAMEPDNRERLEKIEQEIAEVQDRALELHRMKVANEIDRDTYNFKILECGQIMKELEKTQEELKTVTVRYTEVKNWLDNFEENLKSGKMMDTDDATIMKSLIEEIIIYDDRIELQCKCEVTVEQEYVKIETKK